MYGQSKINQQLYLNRPLGTQGLATEDWWKDHYNDLNYYNAGGYSNAIGGQLTKCAKWALASAPFTLGAGAALAGIGQNCKICCSAQHPFNKGKREACISDCHEAKSAWQAEKAKQSDPYANVTPSKPPATKPTAETPTRAPKKGLSTGGWIAIGAGVVVLGVTAYLVFRPKKK